MALVTITVQGTPLYLDENNVLMVYSVGSTIKVDYYDAKSLNVKTVKVSESIATIKAATTSLIELTDLNSSDAFLINKDIISLVEANGSGSKVVLDYKGRDKLISVTENKAAIDLLITPIPTPLQYKALLSQKAPIAATTDPTMVAGQIWTLEAYNAADAATIAALELISGTLYAIGSKYRSATDQTLNVNVATTFSYDGSPYIVSTDVNGDFAPFVNTLGEEPTFSYSGVGDYLGTFISSIVISGKVSFKAMTKSYNAQAGAFRYSNTEFKIRAGVNGGTLFDNSLNYTPFEIEIYP